jgi:hypothetical protein
VNWPRARASFSRASALAGWSAWAYSEARLSRLRLSSGLDFWICSARTSVVGRQQHLHPVVLGLGRIELDRLVQGLDRLRVLVEQVMHAALEAVDLRIFRLGLGDQAVEHGDRVGVALHLHVAGGQGQHDVEMVVVGQRVLGDHLLEQRQAGVVILDLQGGAAGVHQRERAVVGLGTGVVQQVLRGGDHLGLFPALVVEVDHLLDLLGQARVVLRLRRLAGRTRIVDRGFFLLVAARGIGIDRHREESCGEQHDNRQLESVENLHGKLLAAAQ